MTTDTMTPAEALAWLDSLHVTNADGALTNRKWPEAQAARAAVAELIKALQLIVDDFNRTRDCAYGDRSAAYAETARAALARVGGQP